MIPTSLLGIWDLNKTTTATVTRILQNKRSNEQKNSSARAF